MSIQVYADNKEVQSKLTTFSDGAINLWIDPDSIIQVEDYLCLTINTDTPIVQYDNIIELAEDILEEFLPEGVEAELHLPYFPNARADRVFERGMSCPLYGLLATLDTSDVFYRVVTKDLHNKRVVEDFLDEVRLHEQDQKACFKETLNRDETLKQVMRSNDLLICAPDKGAKEKAKSIADSIPVAGIELEKERDPTTGWIKSVGIVGSVDVEELDVLIVDDICDGGMTFIKSAEALRNAGARSVSLYVTHGIFSKGLDIFTGLLDNIVCNQIVMNYVTEKDISNFNKGE